MAWWDVVANVAPTVIGALSKDKTAPQTSTGGQKSSSFWSTPAAGALISGGLGLLGGGISAVGQGKQSDAEMKQRQAEFAAEMAQRQKEFEANQALTRQKMLMDASQMDPLAQQKSRQQAAIMAALIGGAQNIQAPAGLEGFVPGGGMKIPEGGWGNEVKQLLSADARRRAEEQFYQQQQGLGGQPVDLNPFYGGQAAGGGQSYYDSALAQKQASNKALAGALDPAQSTIPRTAKRDWLGKVAQNAKQLF